MLSVFRSDGSGRTVCVVLGDLVDRSTALAGEVGKEERWLVLDAEPDARLAIGFDVTP